MTRYVYGGGGDAVATNTSGIPLSGAVANVYNAPSGGSLVTDLLTLAGSPITQVTSDAQGQIAFQGPDSVVSTLYLDFGSGDRWAVRPRDLDLVVTQKLASGPVLTNPVMTGATLKDITATGSLTTKVPVVVNAATGQSANLQNWAVNNSNKAFMDASGNFNAAGLIGTSLNIGSGAATVGSVSASGAVTAAGAITGAGGKITGLGFAQTEDTTNRTTTSTTYTTLSTSVATSLVVPASGCVQITWTTLLQNNTAGNATYAAPTVSGTVSGTLLAAADATALQFTSSTAFAIGNGSRTRTYTGLTPGETITADMKYRGAGGTSEFGYRYIEIKGLVG